jgi:uncharacterized phage infection (PIP) family protein YhgE
VGLKDATEIVKNGFDAIKSLAILLVICLLVFGSSFLSNILDRLNVTKLEYGGITIDRAQARETLATLSDRLQKAQSDLAAAKGELTSLQANYQSAVDALQQAQNALRAAASTPAVEATLQQAGKALGEAMPALKAATAATAEVQQAVATNNQAIQTLPKGTATSFSIAIVFGGDTTPAAAADEVKRAKNAGFADARILLRQRSYRSVVPFEGQGQAEQALAGIRKLSASAKGAYIVNLANWCPDPKPAGNDYSDCGF